MNRRKFLKRTAQSGAGVWLSDIIRLYAGIHATMMHNAFASSAELTARNYVNFHMAAARRAGCLISGSRRILAIPFCLRAIR
ncbi:MAG: hypothetical protein HC902_06770 [Calothrix sp. SM1_5_4]|nr:hypothetical protein [Calothrix sp. SM1_5_4]